MSRFSLDLSQTASERKVMQAGQYPARIVKAELKTGKSKEDQNDWMRLDLTFSVKDEEVSKDLGQDEPKVYGSTFVAFDKETGKYSDNNPMIGQLLDATELRNSASAIGADVDDSGTEWEYYVGYFTKFAELLSGYDVLVNVGRRAVGESIRAEVTKIAKLED